MSMIDLNDGKFDGGSIFNGGKGGFVEGVTLSVLKRAPSEPTTYPDYKLIATDASGGAVNEGFYAYVPPTDGSKTQEQIETRTNLEFRRLKEIAKAVMGEEYVFTQPFKNHSEALDFVMALVRDNAEGKTFGLFVTYGTPSYPKKYLNFRYLNFIVPAGQTLIGGKNDLLERVEEDSQPQAATQSTSGVSTGGASWT